ncbi:MAG: pyruvate, phosphate dikinase [Bradyrhizobium sp.]|nr:pyruvate, phosphate dikinase [Bradyrhizobium sp.]
MASSLGQWVLALDGSALPDEALVGGKALSIARIAALGLDVPPAFVVTTRACAAVLASGSLPNGLEAEIADGIAWLEAATGRGFGAQSKALLVSVRSGAPVSMPGMMDTVLNLGINATTEAVLAAESGDAAFARDTHRRFIELYSSIVLKTDVPGEAHVDLATWRDAIQRATGEVPPTDVRAQLMGAVRAVFESWNSRRARRYRQHHGIPDDLGTAVTVQAMVFGNMDEQSGSGVLFSRNPLSGNPTPFGEYLPRAQGEDIVSGKRTPLPLASMAEELPEVHARLLAAAARLEEINTDVQDIEFTVERGRLYLLQTRTAKRSAQAAARIAVDLVREGRITPSEALTRLTPAQAEMLLRPRLAASAEAGANLLAQGEGASPGIGRGVAVADPDEAERRAQAGEDVVLVRSTTSPNDFHGMFAAQAIVTEQGGSTSHAAVVGRSLGRPCIVGCGVGALSALVGRTVTVDGDRGRVFEGRLPVEAPDEDADPVLAQLIQWAEERAGSSGTATPRLPALLRALGSESPLNTRTKEDETWRR